MGIEYRIADPSDYASAIDCTSSAFGERPDIARVAETSARTWEPGRLVAAYDGAQVAGTFRSWTTEITVPGLGRLPAAAVSGVSVRPTHRRQGLLKGMAARAHEDYRERGEALAILYASEYPIYGRFGYGPATRWAERVIDARQAVFRDPVPGGVTMATPGAAAADTLCTVFERARVLRAGEISRRDIVWGFRLGLEEDPWGDTWKGFLLIRRDAAGNADGYARYKVKPDWSAHLPNNQAEVQELIAVTDEAYRALWGFLVSLDLVAGVRADLRPADEPLPWLLRNARLTRAEAIGDAVWVRLLDVPKALETRAYERAGSLVLEVVDAEVSGGTRRWLLDASPDGARCTPTDREAELTLPVAALGAAYLGGTLLRDAVLATGFEEHRPGALAEADSLLRTLDAPFCSTFF